MHILLAVLGFVVTLLILLNRLKQGGIDIGWLNPFAWKRRRAWAKKYHTNPIYDIRDPMDATGLLMVAVAKSDGDMSAEQKSEILSIFRSQFHLSDKAATALLGSSVYLLQDSLAEVKQVERVLAPSIALFNREQAQSAVSLVEHVARFDSPENEFQRHIVSQMRMQMERRFED